MLRDDLLLRTRLTPPRPHRRVLPRPQLTARLRDALDARLTIVHAGTGYGKTTALAALKDDAAHLFWLTLDESDRDPQQFLTYLIAAFRLRLPELPEAPLALLGELSNGGVAQPAQVIDALINALALCLDAPALLALDDYHIVLASPEVNGLVERLIAFLPPDLHAVISTRQPVAFGSLPTWRARGETLEIGRADLAFRLDEAAELFRETYGMNLAPDELLLLYDKTEGWPIALQVAGQGLRSGAAQSVFDLLAGGVRSSATLFEYLARELLDRQPPDVAAFLRDTAVLRELTPGACDATRGAASGSAEILVELRNLDLFVVSLGEEAALEERYRYHHLFHDFLLAQWSGDAEGLRERHRRAASYFERRGDGDEAITHWLAGQAYEDAADAIEAIGDDAVRAGRLNRLAGWIDALPPSVLAARPRLQALLGDIYRLRNLYDRALAWYGQAEKTWRGRDDAAGISRALRGQASVYLDTVRPAQAENLLQEALRLSDGTPDREARARLLDLMAENKLNLGKPDEAETLRREAEMLRNEAPADDTLSARVKLRTGKLGQARQALSALAEAEGRAAKAAPEGHAGPPRGHRETVLLLSLVEAFMGQGERSHTLAREGISLGERLESPFITAVGHMRLGHALQVSAGTGERISPAPLPPPLRRAGRTAYSEAISWYRSAIALGDRIAVRRTRTEAMWGMTRAYGYSGDLDAAARCAAEGIETAVDAGDIWLVGLASLALGASYALAGQSATALESLSAALSAFRNCNDTFGRAATRLWMSLAYLDLGRNGEAGAMSHFVTSVDALLALCEANGYDFLFTGPSLLGPPDERRLAPLLIEARGRQVHAAYAQRLLGLMGLPEIKAHPGYRLTVQALGAFRVWRGNEEIAGREWQRDKARQLFQLLLAERGPNRGGRWLQRDQIVERLWPQLAPEAAVRDFKVALNALNKALEPASTAASRAFFFVEREGTAYRLRPEADIWFDAAEFEALCERGLRAPVDEDALRAALDLYGGDYLPDALYDDWAAEPRERLLTLYLRAADRLAEALIERGETAGALDLCGAILARDSCWEHAYRLMMLAYAAQGNRAHALRVYARCVEVLRAELDAPPSAETTRLHRQLSD